MSEEEGRRVMCVTCLESFDEKDVILGEDPDGTCPLCGAPGPFLEDEE